MKIWSINMKRFNLMKGVTILETQPTVTIINIKDSENAKKALYVLKRAIWEEWRHIQGTESLSINPTKQLEKKFTWLYVFVRSVKYLATVLIRNEVLFVFCSWTIHISHPIALLYVCTVDVVPHLSIFHDLKQHNNITRNRQKNNQDRPGLAKISQDRPQSIRTNQTRLILSSSPNYRSPNVTRSSGDDRLVIA